MNYNNLEKESERIYSIFGKLSQNVLKELMDSALCGYDVDAEVEIPYIEEMQEYLEAKYDLRPESTTIEFD